MKEALEILHQRELRESMDLFGGIIDYGSWNKDLRQSIEKRERALKRIELRDKHWSEWHDIRKATEKNTLALVLEEMTAPRAVAVAEQKGVKQGRPAAKAKTPTKPKVVSPKRQAGSETPLTDLDTEPDTVTRPGPEDNDTIDTIKIEPEEDMSLQIKLELEDTDDAATKVEAPVPGERKYMFKIDVDGPDAPELAVRRKRRKVRHPMDRRLVSPWPVERTLTTLNGCISLQGTTDCSDLAR